MADAPKNTVEATEAVEGAKKGPDQDKLRTELAEINSKLEGKLEAEEKKGLEARKAALTKELAPLGKAIEGKLAAAEASVDKPAEAKPEEPTKPDEAEPEEAKDPEASKPVAAKEEAKKEEEKTAKKEKQSFWEKLANGNSGLIAMIMKILSKIPGFGNIMNKYATTDGVRETLLKSQGEAGASLKPNQLASFVKKISGPLTIPEGNQPSSFAFVARATGISMNNIEDLVGACRTTMESQVDGEKKELAAFHEFDKAPDRWQRGDILVIHDKRGKFVPCVVLEAGPPAKAAYQNNFSLATTFNPDELGSKFPGAKLYVAYRPLGSEQKRIAYYRELEEEKNAAKAKKKKEKESNA